MNHQTLARKIMILIVMIIVAGLSLLSTNRQAGAEGDSAPKPLPFPLSNGGVGTLSWTASADSAGSSLSSISGSGPANVAGLSPDLYTEQILIDASSAWSSPHIVFTTLRADCPARQPVEVTLVLDRSGSMGGKPFADAQAAVNNFIDQMELTVDQVGLVSFNHAVTLDHPLTQDGQAVKDAVNALEPGGGTDIEVALQAAQAELLGSRHKPDNQPIIILLSDGFSTGDPIAEATTAKSKAIRIITIGLGNAHQDTLRAIASSPVVDYYYAPTSDKLAAIYTEIIVAIQCGPSGSTVYLPLVMTGRVALRNIVE